ncbi:MAG: hypothetical protein ACFBSC_19755 [Microcoleaceae cyanobacterium]
MGGTPKSMLLLGVSCIAGIAAVGSVFELSSGDPQLGSSLTTLILGLSIPMGIWCFRAAVQDANANQQ